MLKVMGIVALIMTTGGTAIAQPMSGDAARKQAFSPKGVSVEMVRLEFLTPENLTLLSEIVKGYAYYAAVAVAPKEDLLSSEATVLVANHHSTEAAEAAALEGCNAKRTSDAPCVIAGRVRPRGWEPRPLQLSVEATVALGKDYGKSGARAMATSAKTGFFGIGKGAAAASDAMAACSSKGATDCLVVIED